MRMIRGNGGSVAIVVIVLVLVISSLLGSALALSFVSISKTGEVEELRAQALYLAEAGIGETIWYLKNGEEPPEYEDVNFSKWTGRYYMKYERDCPENGKYCISSIGEVPIERELGDRVKRRIDVITDSSFNIINWEERTLEYIP